MYTIQYEGVDGQHRMQEFDSKSRLQLTSHLARFERPILAVYEQTTPITKAMRTELCSLPSGRLSRAAREFATFQG
jgi:hypothetical protein